MGKPYDKLGDLVKRYPDPREDDVLGMQQEQEVELAAEDHGSYGHKDWMEKAHQSNMKCLDAILQ